MSARSAGPWLLVVGMHRSGTSAVTGAAGALGFQLVSPDDRLSSHESNPEHWESLSILLHNDAILAHFGGTWDAPPGLPEGWEDDERMPDRARAAALLAGAYPGPGPAVWKDPRVCLLLPYWRAVLGSPLAAILVWRPALAVARSLQRRNGLPIPLGVALWERYNRSALANLADTDVYVLDYDAMIDDPAGTITDLASWLRALPIFDEMPPWDSQRAVSVVSDSLRHESARTSGDERILLEEQRRLTAHLTELTGGHTSLPALPCDESPWTSAMLDASRSSSVLAIRSMERQVEHGDAEREWYLSELEQSRSEIARLKASSSWRITAPLRSLAALRVSSGSRRSRK